jgi:hypothetical protein
MEFWQVVLGLLTAIFLIFLRAAQLKSEKQKIVATRLRSYLIYWKGFVLDNDLFGIYHFGAEWNDEIREIIKKGGNSSDLVKLEKEKKKKLDDLKEFFLEKKDFVSLDDIKKIKSRLPKNHTEYLLHFLERSEQNIIDGKTFISDEEASNLGVHNARVSIELKMKLTSLQSNALSLLNQALLNPAKFQMQDYIDEIIKISWDGIIVSKNIDYLSNKVDFYTNKNIFELSLLNLKGEL